MKTIAELGKARLDAENEHTDALIALRIAEQRMAAATAAKQKADREWADYQQQQAEVRS